MASDTNELRNQIFGKVAHIVVSGRLLPKGPERPLTNSDFKIITLVNPLVNEEMVANRIADSMVIEVFVNNIQASPGEVRELLMERWTLTWHRMGRTGIQAWTGVSNNSVEKTVVSMMRRVALTSRMTQTIRLLKRSGNTQFELKYRILHGASTLFFGATDETRQVTFHGHDGHLWWHINNQTSFSFTMTYRSNAWTPRSAPTHISPTAIIDNYVTSASSASPAGRSPTVVQATSSAHPSGTGGVQNTDPRHTSKSPPHGPSIHTGAQTGGSHPYTHATGHQRSYTAGEMVVPMHRYHSPAIPAEDEYAASLPTSTMRSASQQLHRAYFSPGDTSDQTAISTSLPKTSFFGSPNAPFSSPPSGNGMGVGVGTGVVTEQATGGQMNSAFGAAMDRVPGSSPPTTTGTSYDRPVRMRSSSASANPIGSVSSTSISPYRVDLSISSMGMGAKSPPSHTVVLPLDMMGGPSTSRPPSSGKLTTPISFGGASATSHATAAPSTPTTLAAPGTHAYTPGNATSTTPYHQPSTPNSIGSPTTPSTGTLAVGAPSRTLGATSPWIQVGATTALLPATPVSGHAMSPGPDSSGFPASDAQWTGPNEDESWIRIIRSPNMPQVVVNETRGMITAPLSFTPSADIFDLYDEIKAFVPPKRMPSRPYK